MLLLAKLALGMTGTIVLAGVYTFHDGVMRVDVDDRGQGHHVHVWAPAAVVVPCHSFGFEKSIPEIGRQISERRVSLVLVRQYRRIAIKPPVDAERRVVP